MHVPIINKNKVVNLKDSKKRYRGEFGGRKGSSKGCIYIIISKHKKVEKKKPKLRLRVKMTVLISGLSTSLHLSTHVHISIQTCTPTHQSS